MFEGLTSFKSLPMTTKLGFLGKVTDFTDIELQKIHEADGKAIDYMLPSVL